MKRVDLKNYVGAERALSSFRGHAVRSKIKSVQVLMQTFQARQRRGLVKQVNSPNCRKLRNDESSDGPGQSETNNLHE